MTKKEVGVAVDVAKRPVTGSFWLEQTIPYRAI